VFTNDYCHPPTKLTGIIAYRSSCLSRDFYLNETTCKKLLNLVNLFLPLFFLLDIIAVRQNMKT